MTIHACSFTSLSHVRALSQSSHCSLFEIFSLVKQELPGKGRSGQRLRKQLRRRRRNKKRGDIRQTKKRERERKRIKEGERERGRTLVTGPLELKSSAA